MLTENQCWRYYRFSLVMLGFWLGAGTGVFVTTGSVFVSIFLLIPTVIWVFTSHLWWVKARSKMAVYCGRPLSNEEWLSLCAGDHVDETEVQRRHVDALMANRGVLLLPGKKG